MDIKKAARDADLKRNFGEKFEGFDAYGKPKIAGQAALSYIDAASLLNRLEQALSATGDPIFQDAAQAFKAYEFDRGRPLEVYRRAHDDTWGASNFGYLQNMKWLIENRRPVKVDDEGGARLDAAGHPIRHEVSIRVAANDIAANYFSPGTDFDDATRKLRDAYSSWKEGGFLDQVAHYDGDLGRMMHVAPMPGHRVPTEPALRQSGIEFLPTGGAIVPWSRYWRRMFEDGVISIHSVK